MRAKVADTYNISKKMSDGTCYLIAFFASLIFTNVAIYAFAIPLYTLVGAQNSNLINSGDAASLVVYTHFIELGSIIPQVICYLLFLCIVGIVFKEIFVLDYIDFKKAKGRNIAIIASASIIMYFVDIITSNIYYAVGVTGTSANQLMIYGLLSSSAMPIALILVILLAPIVEEIIYRKFMIGLFHEKFKFNIWIAGLLSAALFSLIHVISGLDQLVYFPLYFVSAISLVIAYIVTNKNIYVSIIIHMINNAISVILWMISTLI